ncbi:MAG TPA: response regulator transcription factor [Candidatus Limnocylindrales bacterium]|nr:response regulator transcription factor [Candidatus Limnocylindrales bacterium]
MKPLRILIADDHEFIRRGIRAVLEKQPNCEIVGEAADGREAVQLAATSRPDIAILDVTMPELNGFDATRQMLQENPNIKVLVLSMHESEQIVREVLASGARGYILKSDAGRDLLSAVDSLASGKPFFTSKVSELLLNVYLKRGAAPQESGDPPSVLTAREREILQLLAQGKSNKEVATALYISVRTVETHRSNMMSKLNLHSMAELVRYALKNQIAS